MSVSQTIEMTMISNVSPRSMPRTAETTTRARIDAAKLAL